MPQVQAPIIKGDAVDTNADYRDALLVNMLAVLRPIRGASGYILSHPGLVELGQGSGIDRAGIWNERLQEHLRVSGTDLISLSTSGTATTIGTISGTDRPSLAYSFNTQAIVADGKMWLYDGSTLSPVTDVNLGNPIDITWIDGYYFLTDGEFLYHTDLTDESSIDPLQTRTSEFSPDPTLAVDKTSDNQVIVFNRYSTEYFENVATENFAFRRIKGKALKAGIVGTHCETELNGTFFILGGGKEESPSIHFLTSGTYQSVATREIDKILASYSESELSEAVLETRVEDRDQFIVVRLPRQTLLYNHTIAKSMGLSSAWTIVKSQVVTDGAWRGVNGVYDPRIPCWVYGDNLDATIGCLDNSVASQYGEDVESIFYTPLIPIENASVNQIEIDTLPGHQIDPDKVTIAVSFTYDGVTHQKEYWNLESEQFEYDQRFIIRRLGYVRNFIGFKGRAVTGERLAFSLLRIDYA